MILFFIGASLGAIVKKGGLGVPVLITIILFLIYFILLESGETMVDNEVVSPFWGIWLSSIVLTPIGIFLAVKANKDSSIFDLEFYKRIFRKRKDEKTSAM